MEYNNKIYPYISTIKSMEEISNDTYIATLENGAKTLVGIETFIGDTVFCIPEGTILSSEFLNKIDYLYDLVDSDYKMLQYSTEDGSMVFDCVSLPLGFVAFNTDIKYEDVEKYPKHTPIKGFITNSNEELIISPDYSVDPINYKFDPSKYVEEYEEKIDNKETSEEEAKSTEDLEDIQSTEAKKEFPQQFLTPEQIEKLLEIRDYSEFKEKNINARDWIVSIFSNRKEDKPDGKGFEVLPPLIPIEGYFKLPANTLPNQPEEILTTAGLYVFNMFCIASAFKHKIPYINHEMNAKALEGFNNELASLLLDNKIQIKGEIEVFQNNITFISYLTELFMPGISIELLEELPEVKKMKKELVKRYKKEIDAGDAAFYADNVEKPLLAEAKKILSTDESWDIYSIGKKPTFDNNYKSNVVSIGPIRNPITESYDIISNSYDNGVELDKYAAYCNQLISGTYDRSVKTQYGGAKTKQIFAAMGNIITDEPGSDCGTKKTLKMILTKDEAKNYLYSFIVDPKNPNELIELSTERIGDFIGKEIELRSPLYCCSKKICNKCLGNLYYRLGIKTIGVATSRISASLMYISMKSFHDQSIKTMYIDLKKYLEKT